MTTIAFTKGVMAADSCVTHGNVRSSSVCKIWRLSSGALLGIAGDADCRDLIPVLDKARDYKRLPSRKELADLKINSSALLVFRSGKAVYINTGELDDSHNHYFAEICELNTKGIAAIGSGSDIAMGAMFAGASARQAVAIACQLDIYSRAPIHVFKL